MPLNAKTSGGCMCRAVRFDASGQPLYAGYCHSRSCRHHSGAAVAGMVVFLPETIEFTGELSVYASSPGVERGFCAQCGTSLSWKGNGLMSLHIGALDNPDQHAPTLHWRWEERSIWSEAAGFLPHVEMVFPQ